MIYIYLDLAWIICNSDIKIEQLQGQLKTEIKLNDTAAKQIQNAIGRQTKLLVESKSFLDTGKIGRIKNILENLTSVEISPKSLWFTTYCY